MSGTGQYTAIIATVNGLRSVMVIDSAKNLVSVIPIKDAKVRRIEWAGDDFLLIHYTLTVDLPAEFTTSKAELEAVVVTPPSGVGQWNVFDGVSTITGGVWDTYGVIQREGHWYGYFGGVTLIFDYKTLSTSLPDGVLHDDLYEVDLATHRTRRVAKSITGDDTRRDWLLDGNGEIGASLDFLKASGRWTIRGKNGETITSGVSELGHVGLIGFTPDGSELIYSAGVADEDGRIPWQAVPLAGGTPRPYLDDVTFDEAFWDRGHRLLGYRDNQNGGERHFFNARHQQIFRASEKAFPESRMDLIGQSDDFEKLLVETQGPGDPQTWWRIDIKTGKADELGMSYPIAADAVGPMKMIPYKAADGLSMEGVLTLPPDREAQSLPAIVLPHGGPAAHDEVGFDWLAQAFASRGYAVFQPNFRGSTGYGSAFKDAGNGEWGRKMQTDISDGLAELVRQGIVDPARVCIVGASYGGYAALAGVTLQQGIYRCAVAIAGISDLPRMVRDETTESGHDPVMSRNLKIEIGTGRDLKAVSPIEFVDKVTAPVLLIHGKDDTVVNFTQSKIMADALKRAGKPFEFVTLPHEDHWLSSSDTRLVMLQSSVDFVMKHNPPDVSPGAVSPAP